MPSLADHSSGSFVKLLYIGSSGSGKTGSLVSLVPDYNLRILDLDNGLDALVNLIRRDCPNRIASVEYETRRDTYKATAMGIQVAGSPRAFTDSIKLLDKWSDGSNPAEWGSEYILVVDSLTNLGKAAFAWARGMNPSSKDPRQWYAQAQAVLDDVLATLTAEAFATNVIVCSHVDFVEDGQGFQRGYASSIGKALGPKIPRYFNTMLLAESKSMGKTTKRTIKTAPTNLIDLKNPAPWKVEAEYDLTDGLARIFKELKGG